MAFPLRSAIFSTIYFKSESELHLYFYKPGNFQTVLNCSDFRSFGNLKPQNRKLRNFEFECCCAEVDRGGTGEYNGSNSEDVMKESKLSWDNLFENADMDRLGPRKLNKKGKRISRTKTFGKSTGTESTEDSDNSWRQVFEDVDIENASFEIKSDPNQSKSSVRKSNNKNSENHFAFLAENPFLIDFDGNEDEYSGLTWDSLFTGKDLDGKTMREKYGSRYFLDRDKSDSDTCTEKSWDTVFSGADESRLGPKKTKYLYWDKRVKFQSKKYNWCCLCGLRQGWMACNACNAQGYYATKPGLGGVKDKVRLALCKICYGRKIVPCIICGISKVETWLKWQNYARKHPKK